MNFPYGRAVIVGGGITGLSAAWEIRRRSPNSSVTVLEKEGRWGGKILTHRFSTPESPAPGESAPDGPAPGYGEFISDAGPESFITRKPEVWTLAHELGIQDRIVNADGETRGMYILEKGRALEVPLSPGKFLRSPLLSSRAKLRILFEPLVPRRRDAGDESLADFFTRRLGREAFERMIGPVLAGIHGADPHRQSMLSTFSILREMEREFGGLIPGALARGRIARRRKRTLQKAGEPVPPRYITFESGTEELVEALVSRLNARHTDLRLTAEVQDIRPTAEGFQVITPGSHLRADAVILAVPANRAASWMHGIAPEAASAMARIRHSHIGTIALAFQGPDSPGNSAGINGLIIPPRENLRIDAVIRTSNKMPPRAPKGCSLLKVFFGINDPEMLSLSDDELTAVVLDELRRGLGLSRPLIGRRIYRAPGSFPQADVGHPNLVRDIETRLPAGLYAAGASYRGIGVPDCIRQGRLAARNAAEHIARLSQARRTRQGQHNQQSQYNRRGQQSQQTQLEESRPKGATA